ncbi:MAG: AAA family ATPase [Thermodesulfobacteriota bacterium]|nr:AAA family ATPase [Thermodesulfobacteriota bacterium]
MYNDFYKLQEKPFNLTPSPRFLYLGEIHKEALALLTYGVVERKGFILLTGEVGTGKTTMIQALLDNLDANVHCINMSNPLLTSGEFIDYLAYSVFKKKIHFKSKADFLITFEDFLKEYLQEQKTFVLIVDEAQTLSFEVLEEIRLLSNMETADEKLINIFLVGQPELNQKLNTPRLRPLLQRVSVRYHIRPLDYEGTRDYIEARLKIAGIENSKKIFPKKTIEAIHRYSKGYPRTINVLGDNSLLLGYAGGAKRITPEMVAQCHENLKLDFLSTREGNRERKKTEKSYSEKKRRSKWQWAALLLVALSILFIISSPGRVIVSNVSSFFWEYDETSEMKAEPPLSNEDRSVRVKVESASKETPVATPQSQSSGEKRPLTFNEEAKTTEEIRNHSLFPVITKGPGDKKDITQEDESASWTRVDVEEGDTVTGLAIKIYGRVDEATISLLAKSNPHIEDLDQINVGDQIVFPPILKKNRGSTYTVHIASFRPFSYASGLFKELIMAGYEAYILPVNDPRVGKIFRVTLGNFSDPKRAEAYAQEIRETGISDYTRLMLVEMK